MENPIENLRAICGEGEIDVQVADSVREILEILEVTDPRITAPQGYTVEEMERAIRERSHRSNWEVTICKVTEGEEVAYFEYWIEVPLMEGLPEREYRLREVVPKEVTVIQYVPKEADE